MEVEQEKKIFFSNDGHALAQHLRVVAEELNRSSDVLDGTVNDAINFFDEVNGSITNNKREQTPNEEVVEIEGAISPQLKVI